MEFLSAEALQIVSTGDEDTSNEFILREENLEKIVSSIPQGMKVAVLSVVGAFRTGKSFLLNFFLRYLRHGVAGEVNDEWMTIDGSELSEGNVNERKDGTSAANEVPSFHWRGGQKRQTTGIWMWSKPFIKKCPQTGEDMALLLMDTQGMFDNETTMTLTAQIFGLSTMVSSLQVYNVQNRIQEDNLQHLALFSEYGRLALHADDMTSMSSTDRSGPSGTAESEPLSAPKLGESPLKAALHIPSESEGGLTATEPSAPSSVTEPADDKVAGEMTPTPSKSTISPSRKPFQRLQFLVRDSSIIDDFDPDAPLEEQDQRFFQLRGDMHSYFQDVIRDRGVSDLQSTRDQITRCFEVVDCFLLPHPGTAITSKKYDGKIAAIDKMFLALLNRYIRQIFEHDIAPKHIGNNVITGKDLLTYFQVYCKMFQEGQSSFPKAMTMLEATAEANNRNAFDNSLYAYKSAMVKIAGPDSPFLKDSEITVHHERSLAASLKSFDAVATMGSIANIEKFRDRLCGEIELEWQRFSHTNSLKNPYLHLEFFVLPLIVAAVSWLVASFVDRTCSSDICEATESGFRKIYGFIIFCCVVYGYRKFSGSFQHLKTVGIALAKGKMD